MNAQEFFSLLNTAVTRRNIARHRMMHAIEAKNRKVAEEYHSLMLGWEARAKSYATKVGTRIVPMPDHPEAIIAASILSRIV